LSALLAFCCQLLKVPARLLFLFLWLCIAEEI